MSDLTTLAAAKSYLGITTTAQDALISALIPRVSSHIQRHCAQEFPTKSYSGYKLNGTGSDRIVLPGPPILSVSSVQVGSEVIEASSDGMTTPGYAFQDFTLYLIPGTYGLGASRFTVGFNNVKLSWVGGYQSSETDYVPTGNTPTLTPSTDGNASTNVSVTYAANGVALTQVGNGPTVGQYSFSAGVYTFNSANYNDSVTMTYYYVPAVVEQVAIESIGMKLKQRDNLGISSRSLAGESVTYSDKDMTAGAKSALIPFVRRAFT